MSHHKLEDVFGINRNIPLSYTERDSVDNIFLESLDRQRHIIIYGSSKQGKTSLRKNHLNEEKYISFHCNPALDISNINSLILKNAGLKITISEKQISSDKLNAKATIGIKLFAKAEGQASLETESSSEIEKKSLDIDLGDTNDIIKALKSIGFKKVILLEDFHYLKKETQIDFASALKIYHENSSILFIIIGVWLEENRLIALNGDLAGRITSINVDSWSYQDLSKVIEKGCRLLNVRFEDDLIDKIIQQSFDNVSFVQELCYRVCKEFRIIKTVSDVDFANKKENNYDDDQRAFDNRYFVKNNFKIENVIKDLIQQYSARYLALFSQFLNDTKENDSEIYRQIFSVIIETDNSDLIKGLTLSSIKGKINCDLKHLKIKLKSFNERQSHHGIIPNIIDFDETQLKLNIVDKIFIIWLDYQDKNELLNF